MSSEQTEVSGPDFTSGVMLGDFGQNSMLLGHVGDEPVVLARNGDDMFAVGASCTHYGGPLNEGYVDGDRVICPWHHACFSLRTGEAVAAPAMDPIPCWKVERDGDKIFVREKLTVPSAPSRTNDDPSNVVIIGGGAAGFACAEMLRRRGYGGAITMLSADTDYPVDRPNLSKDFLAGEAEAAWMPLRSKSFYPKNNIDLKLNAVVDEIDLNGRKVVLKDGASYDFDRLLIATGANPVKLPIAGAEQDHVFTLRSYQDSRDIVAAAEHAKSAVILGSGFIGLEVAASLRQRDLDVHVVSMDELPLEKVMGRDVGVFIKQLHESHDVKFYMQTTIDKIDANTVTLKDGTELPAELVIIGVGVKPDTELAEVAGLKVDKGILVNAELESYVPGVFAAGDVARWNDGEQTHRVEHWVVAERQGQVVAENMLGAQQKYVDAPFFWSAHYDVTIRYAGDGMGWDDASIEGDLLKHDALVRYRKDGKLIAVAGIGRDAEIAKIATELRTL